MGVEAPIQGWTAHRSENPSIDAPFGSKMSGNPRLCWSFMEINGGLGRGVKNWCLTPINAMEINGGLGRGVKNWCLTPIKGFNGPPNMGKCR